MPEKHYTENIQPMNSEFYFVDCPHCGEEQGLKDYLRNCEGAMEECEDCGKQYKIKIEAIPGNQWNIIAFPFPNSRSRRSPGE